MLVVGCSVVIWWAPCGAGIPIWLPSWVSLLVTDPLCRFALSVVRPTSSDYTFGVFAVFLQEPPVLRDSVGSRMMNFGLEHVLWPLSPRWAPAPHPPLGLVLGWLCVVGGGGPCCCLAPPLVRGFAVAGASVSFVCGDSSSRRLRLVSPCTDFLACVRSWLPLRCAVLVRLLFVVISTLGDLFCIRAARPIARQEGVAG